MRDVSASVPAMQPSDPEGMRHAMASYVRGIHASYLDAADLLPPAERARLPLLEVPELTVAAVGTRLLHVIATTERLPEAQGPEVALEDAVGPVTWTLRFYDPVVVPALGLLDDSAGTEREDVRRLLGIRTVVYHLVVPPGGSLTAHHATHAGTGLAHSHAAAARDFDALRAYCPGREGLVDEMQGAAVAGLNRAQVLLARALSPAAEECSLEPPADPADVRRALLAAVRPSRGGPA